MLSRRAFLGGVAGGSGLVAGCLGTENVAHCSSEGLGGGSQHLRRVAPIEGDEQVALGVLVSEEAAAEGAGRAVTVRNRDDDLVTTIPLSDNRDMSELDPDDYSIFSPEEGELYAVPLGRPPVHGEYTVALIGPDDDDVRATVRLRFNCYAADGTLP
ncbi:hypothetical protein NDI76_07760 [Halogeometricum sp. S1BR25-6]|uniref:Uncharacterized protein n=1 Tax=Halogeometricum salsisoli TaxID=2950536 RepID=A0ABU2GD06_9EURY|nr:hypothetical protein [Halogeometricum sp. S1BR25-6]MDS0298634.1 hypothetical protein [Halogeometricum sp. S1BR25-6]